MKLKIDDSKYDDLHMEFLNRMMHSIKDCLAQELQWTLELEEEVDVNKLCDLAETIGFCVNSVIDGCDVLGVDNIHRPQLAFKKNDTVMVNESGSYLHEMTMGSLEEWQFAQLEEE